MKVLNQKQIIAIDITKKDILINPEFNENGDKTGRYELRCGNYVAEDYNILGVYNSKEKAIENLNKISEAEENGKTLLFLR